MGGCRSGGGCLFLGSRGRCCASGRSRIWRLDDGGRRRGGGSRDRRGALSATLCVLTLSEREDGDIQGRGSSYTGSNGAMVVGVPDDMGSSEGIG